MNDKNQAQAGKIYLSVEGTYIVRDLQGIVQAGKLQADVDLRNLPDRLNNSELRKHILAAIATHIQITDEGFDYYATDNIIDLVNREYLTSDRHSDYIDIPAFTPVRELSQNNSGEEKQKEIKISRDDRISEARSEFKRIVINQIRVRLTKLSSMNEIQRDQYIQEQQNTQRKKEENSQIMARAAAIPRSAESQTITEEEWMRRENPDLNLVRARFPGLFNIASSSHQLPSQQNRISNNLSQSRDLSYWEREALRDFRGLTEDMLRRAVNNNPFGLSHYHVLTYLTRNGVSINDAIQRAAQLSVQEAIQFREQRLERPSNQHQSEVKLHLPTTSMQRSESVFSENKANEPSVNFPSITRNPSGVANNNPPRQERLNLWEINALERLSGLTEDMIRRANSRWDQFTGNHYRALDRLIRSNVPVNEALQRVAQLSREEAGNIPDAEQQNRSQQTRLFRDIATPSVSVQPQSVTRESLLATPNAVRAFQDGLIRMDQLDNFNIDYLKALFSDNGIYPLERHLITMDQISRLPVPYLQTLFSDKGIYALENNIINMEAVMEMMIGQLNERIASINIPASANRGSRHGS